MRKLKGSVSLEELHQRFGFAANVVDALIDSGQLFCSFAKGEQRVPLGELESFFREGLLRVYEVDSELLMREREERTIPQWTPVPKGEPPRPFTPRHEVTNASEELPSPEPREDAALQSASSVAEGADVAARTPTGPDARTLADRTGENLPEVPANSARATAVPAGDGAVAPTSGVETRSAMRFLPLRPIDGLFDGVRFTVLQLSTSGLRVRHEEPLLPGQEGKLSIALIHAGRSFMMRGRVVWTSLASYEDDQSRSFCISGITVTDHSDQLHRLVEIMKSAHQLQPDRRASTRPGRRLSDSSLNGISDQEVTAIMGAIKKFASDPLEASRWYARARFALSDPQIRRDAPARERDREEALGIWESLDRSIDLGTIVTVLDWSRRTRVDFV